ncbi:MAG: hypothetical protein H6859_08295 [Rhodospirillales bacterium]|nr:hypothetical protein [Alphaproteobacteria bacterium]USO05144.1 MAG: hypothetical protein H6859_08295 [Rhodospirillales bacterium]
MNEGLQRAAGILPQTYDMRGLKTLAAFERDYIEHILQICQGNIPRAAEILDIAPSTLYRKRAAWDKNRV